MDDRNELQFLANIQLSLVVYFVVNIIDFKVLNKQSKILPISLGLRILQN